jgi:hypothetical protein
MDASQLWYTEIVHSGPKHEFFIFYVSKVREKLQKHSQTLFWVQWTRMDASQLWYPEILHSGPKHEFFLFYQSRVCEMLRNTSKHHFVSNGLEYASQLWYPEIVHSGLK